MEHMDDDNITMPFGTSDETSDLPGYMRMLTGATLSTMLTLAVVLAIWGPKFRALASSLASYWGCLYYFWVSGGTYEACPYFRKEDELQSRVQVYSLALIMSLWDRPHYRNGTFQDDMIKNLRNVALPGTGIPLSLLCYFKATGYLFLVFGYPLVALVAAANAVVFHADECQGHNGSDGRQRAAGAKALTLDRAFQRQLLEPQDWFSFWRLNCRLATFHSSVTGSKDYSLEDKWTFLRAAEAKQVPVSPSLDLPGVVLKHRNEEGGMGFARYFGPSGGGDWIIQPILRNGPGVARLLPKDAPLSTFRVITASRHGIPGVEAAGKAAPGRMVEALSTVFRAGLAGAATDHSSILFDVDVKTGKLRRGTTNNHWYKLGLRKALRTPWTSTHDRVCHPDTGLQVEGETVPEVDKIIGLAVDAHRKLCPEVPLVGWDVSLTEKHGRLLLEGNFSCNFFRGQFDLRNYLEFVDDYFTALAPSVGM